MCCWYSSWGLNQWSFLHLYRTELQNCSCRNPVVLWAQHWSIKVLQTLTHNCCFSVASGRWNYQQPCMLCTGSSRGPTNTTCTTGIPAVMLHQWFGGLLLSYLLGGSWHIFRPGIFFCTLYLRGRRIAFSSLTTCVCLLNWISLWPTSKLPSALVTNVQPACGQQRKAGHKWPSCESGELNKCAVKCCWQKSASWIKFSRMYEGWKNNCRLFWWHECGDRKRWRFSKFGCFL